MERYVDDTFGIQDKQCKDKFLQHINSIAKIIELTVEDTRQGGAMPFLETIIIPIPEGMLSTGVYRKPTHTYIYNGTVITIYLHNLVSLAHSHTAKTACSRTTRKRNATPSGNTYPMQIPKLGLNKIQNRTQPKHEAPNSSNNTKPADKYKAHIVIPTQKAYVKASRICVIYLAYKHTSEVAEY